MPLALQYVSSTVRGTRMQGLRNRHGVALGQAAGHQRTFGQRGRAVVHGGVGHFMPSRRAMSVWNSKMPCSAPWLISGWYGV